MGNFFWPVLDEMESIKDALRYAAVVSGMLCGYDLIFLNLRNLYVIAICAVYALAVWRIWKGSQGWAFAAFAVLCLQIPWTFIVLLLFAFPGLMNGVRAAIAFQRMKEQADIAAMSQP
jgi:hypothetical protein